MKEKRTKQNSWNEWKSLSPQVRNWSYKEGTFENLAPNNYNILTEKINGNEIT